MYYRPRGFIRDKDALTIFYTKMLNESFQSFVNTTSDFDKIVHWRFSQNFIWRYCICQLSDFRLLQSLFPYRYSPIYVTFGKRNEKKVLLGVCGFRDNQNREDRTFWERGWRCGACDVTCKRVPLY